ncbi:MAG: GTP-binding protein [Candidatus Lokiarchaeota archaeon]|nr:GTP-binding protein [Candidatus Lokiarchaeota archaeon]
MAEEYDYLFKSIVVGDGGVGKTALTLRFSKGFFTEDYKMTIGVDFHVKTINIDSNEGLIRAKLQIWDTGGQERFSSIRPMYYRGSLGALLIFDLTNSATFEHLPGWIEEVRANVKNEIPLLLVGNKSDLVDQRAVSLDEINVFTRDFNLFYMETSAKTGEGVGDCFYILACLMIGSGIPDQLIANNIVFNPGKIPITATEVQMPSPYQEQPDFEYSAPPVPEPGSVESSTPSPSFEPEPEFEYSAPPVPEPAPVESSAPSPSFEPEFEPEIPIPEPEIVRNISSSTDFEFKTPEEILAGERSEEIPSASTPPFQGSSISTSEEKYKPRSIPFASNVPVPAPTPEGFQSPQDIPSGDNQAGSTAPFAMLGQGPQSKSDFLVDYMPEPIISKKDKKKLEKQKKKEEKEEKIQDEQEKQQKLLEEMKSAKKEKKEKSKKDKKEKAEYSEPKRSVPSASKTAVTEPSSTPSLFQALTQKSEETTTNQSSPFVPFSATKKSQFQEESKLRIIPDATAMSSKPSGFTSLQPTTSNQNTSSNSSSKELIICKNCGAMLSSDYAFCNKCGSHL